MVFHIDLKILFYDNYKIEIFVWIRSVVRRDHIPGAGSRKFIEKNKGFRDWFDRPVS